MLQSKLCTIGGRSAREWIIYQIDRIINLYNFYKEGNHIRGNINKNDELMRYHINPIFNGYSAR